jgi:hypothetical protein
MGRAARFDVTASARNDNRETKGGYRRPIRSSEGPLLQTGNTDPTSFGFGQTVPRVKDA